MVQDSQWPKITHDAQILCAGKSSKNGQGQIQMRQTGASRLACSCFVGGERTSTSKSFEGIQRVDFTAVKRGRLCRRAPCCGRHKAGALSGTSQSALSCAPTPGYHVLCLTSLCVYPCTLTHCAVEPRDSSRAGSWGSLSCGGGRHPSSVFGYGARSVVVQRGQHCTAREKGGVCGERG